MTVAAYPGSFDPPTVAHLAVAEAAWRQCRLDHVDLVVSRSALGKDALQRPSLDDRVEVLEAVASSRPWLGVRVTDARLVADVAGGYDVVVLGADKWAQVLDPTWYGGSTDARDEAVARLPRVLVAPRAGHDAIVHDMAERLDLHPDHLEVSSTAARAGRADWLLPEAATAAEADPQRYARWTVRPR